MKQDELGSRIGQLEQEHNGRFAIHAVDLNSDEMFDLRSSEVLPTASTCKLFVLCELFRQAEEGRIDLAAPIQWDEHHRRRGDGVLRAFRLGDALSAYNHAVLMMIISDNIATNLLTELVGAENVTATMQNWGLTDTDIHGGLPGGPNAASMTQPVSTARDLCSLITRIYRHELLTPEICDDIIRILRAQRCNDMLPRRLPVGEDWGDAETWIANKTGYGRCRVEVGVVQLKEKAYSLGMFFRPDQSPKCTTKCLADYPPVLAMASACHELYKAFAE